MSEKLNELKTKEEQEREEGEIDRLMVRFGWSREVAANQYRAALEANAGLDKIIGQFPNIFGDAKL